MNIPTQSLKDYPEQVRPREKMELLGAAQLTDTELLAILLNTGNKEQNVLQLAESFLRNVGGIRGLMELSLQEMREQKGIGPAKATTIMASVEIGKRMMASRGEYRVPITSASIAAEQLLPYFSHEDREHFAVLILNQQKQVIGMETVSIGTINSSPVHPREVFKQAIKRSAAAIILAHNHPSGNLLPSSQDRAVTQRLIEVGKLVGIDVLDHIILAEGNYYSFAEHNEM